MTKLSLLLLLIFGACTTPLPQLEGMNLEKWRDDKNGCNGDREPMNAALLNQIGKLKGLSEMDVLNLLGKPDENELYTRNQKFYSYYVTPGPDCEDHKDLPDKLVIRFNALGYAQLVTLGPAGQ